MEDTLEATKKDLTKHTLCVLILVLMEDTLEAVFQRQSVGTYFVLILVLMEDTLEVFLTILIFFNYGCLNPCFNGRYS